jgi:cold shock CspA family protein
MMSLWLLLPFLGNFNAVGGEEQRYASLSKEERRPLESLLLVLTPAGARINRHRLSSPSYARFQPRMAKGQVSTWRYPDEAEQTDIAAASAEAKQRQAETLDDNGYPIQKMKGDIKVFFHKKKFGFVSCPEVQTKYGRDALLLASDMVNLRIGDRVTFDVEEQEKDGDKRPKAINVKLWTRSPAFNEAKKLANATDVEEIDSSAAMAEVEELTEKFSLAKTSKYEGELREKWGSFEKVCKISADVSDLDSDQRSRVVGTEGFNLQRITDQCGADFVWMDFMGKVYVYSPTDQQARYAYREVMQLVVSERQQRENAEKATEQSLETEAA